MSNNGFNRNRRLECDWDTIIFRDRFQIRAISLYERIMNLNKAKNDTQRPTLRKKLLSIRLIWSSTKTSEVFKKKSPVLALKYITKKRLDIFIMRVGIVG